MARCTKKTLGANEKYGTKGMIAKLARNGMKPHITKNIARRGDYDNEGGTSYHEGCAKAINVRSGIE